MRVRIGVFLLGSAGMIFGQQQQFWLPEVRKAIPVEKPTPTPEQIPKAIPVEKPDRKPAAKDSYQNPAWMERIQPSPEQQDPGVDRPANPRDALARLRRDAPVRDQGR